jgi:alkanesulfonate monooxygenase SsuD/methylene tetrahydromethanopterin reductase-like flavin-dependent oxidoreductase (luciferase family)
MRYGIYVPSFGRHGDPDLLCDLAVSAQAAGWDGFFMWDHVVFPPPVADPWVTLGAVARETSTITIGPMIVPLPRRRPWHVALSAGTLQRLSGGRLVVGVGLGVPWDYTNFGESARRADRIAKLEEGLTLLRSLLTGERVDHDGDHFQVHDVEFTPADVPVWLGGMWPRTTPVPGAPGCDGLFPLMRRQGNEFRLATPDEVRGMRTEFVAAGGRAEGDLVLWAPGEHPRAADVAAYEDAGVTWWLGDSWKVPLDELRERIAAGPPR